MELATTAGLMLDAGLSLKQAKHLVITELLKGAMRRCSGNQCRAARLLHIHRNTFSRLADETGIPTQKRYYTEKKVTRGPIPTAHA